MTYKFIRKRIDEQDEYIESLLTSNRPKERIAELVKSAEQIRDYFNDIFYGTAYDEFNYMQPEIHEPN